MPETTLHYDSAAIVEAFHSLLPLGDEILIPFSVTEDTLKRNTSRSSDEITSYLHRFEFESFFLSVIYTPKRSDLTSAPSTLEVRISLDRSETLYFFMPTDLIPFINPKDMLCRYYPYIESPERLASCYRDLLESLVPYLDDFERLASNDETRERAYRDLKNEMARCYGEDIDKESGKGEDYDRALAAMRFFHFVKWKSSFYSSNEYAAFCSGNTTALSAIAFRGARPDYIKHLALSSFGMPQGNFTAVQKESASLPACVEATRNARNTKIFAIALAITLPLVAILLTFLYFAVANAVGADSLFYSATTAAAYIDILSSVFIGAFALAIVSYPLILRLFFKKRYAAYRPYRDMNRESEKKTLFPKTRYLLLFLCVMFTIFTACRGVRFYEDRILVQSRFIPSTPIQLDYEDVKSVEAKDNANGSFYYVITMENGDTISLASFMTKSNCEDIQNALEPVFERYGITVDDGSDAFDDPFDPVNGV